MNDDCLQPQLPWFGLRVRSRSEQVAALALTGKGYRPFFPAYKQVRQWNDRKKQVEVPLFPGYVFCRFDPERRLPILTTPGVLEVVGLGKTPAPIEGAEIEAIRALVASGLPAEPCFYRKTGDRVELTTGPLRGIEGIVAAIKDRERLIMSVTLLQRSVAVEIDNTWIRRVG